MYNVALWLRNHQWQAAKNGEDEGHPTGPYGEAYATRRAHTDETHPDWTKGHSHADALRVAFKRFLVDLWETWVDLAYPGQPAADAQTGSAGTAAAGQCSLDAHQCRARGGSYSRRSKIPGQSSHDAHNSCAGVTVAGQPGFDTQRTDARGGKKKPGHRSTDAQVASAGKGEDELRFFLYR
jgi:hypothetical protein